MLPTRSCIDSCGHPLWLLLCCNRTAERLREATWPQGLKTDFQPLLEGLSAAGAAEHSPLRPGEQFRGCVASRLGLAPKGQEPHGQPQCAIALHALQADSRAGPQLLLSLEPPPPPHPALGSKQVARGGRTTCAEMFAVTRGTSHLMSLIFV